MNTMLPLAHLEALITQEEHKGSFSGLDDLQTPVQFLHRTRERLGRLPKLPALHEVHWAQAMLALPNLAFLQVDTDGLGTDANVLRVLLIEQHEQLLVDTCLQRPLSDNLLAISGLTRQQMDEALPLEQGWPSIVEAMRGRYLLCYNLAFDRNRLQRQAERAHQELPFLVADCLMERATGYFRTTPWCVLAWDIRSHRLPTRCPSSCHWSTALAHCNGPGDHCSGATI